MGHRRQCKLTEGSLLPSTERPHLGIGAQVTLPLRRGGLRYLTISSTPFTDLGDFRKKPYLFRWLTQG
jgi:hypothetical protein